MKKSALELALAAVTGVAALSLAALGDGLPEARRWFEGKTGEMMEKARRVRTDGRPAYAPQTSNHYKASWLGDFEFMLEADVVPREDVLDAALAFFDGLSSEGDGVNCITYDGRPIYQPGYGTFGTNAICDGVPYTIDVMYLAWRKTRERALVESKVLNRLVKATARIPHDPEGNTDLVWIDPAHPWDRSAFGFHDTVRKQGDCFFESVLEWEAFGRLAEMLAAGGRGAEAEAFRARRAKLAADINRTFWDESASLYRAATVQCREHDVWGSAFAVWAGLASAERADAVARRFRDDFDGLVRNGQVRHCLPGVYWEKACQRDRYQNGGFWGTPVGWFAYALERVAPELVDRMYAELVADYGKRGVSEWTFGDKVAIPEGFLGSAVWPLAGLKRICAARASKANPALHGDGVTDDTDAIQTMLDARTSCVYLPPPRNFYLISRALELESGQTLRLDPGTRVKLAPKSDCHMLVNRNWRTGDRDIAVIGGVWDLDNASQSPNPHQGRHCKPPRKIALPKAFQRDFFRGEIFCFDKVEDLTVRDVMFRNPTTYSLQMTRTSYFVIDGVTFDFDSWNPIPLNMDGVHCDGGCHHGKISNLRGTCFDDLVALNANDGICAAYEGEIADIDIDGIYADYCHSAVRLLSAGADLKRVTIRNVHGNFYTYAVGLTHYFPEKPRGWFDDIVISDVFAAKAFAPEGIGANSRTNYPPIWVEGPVDVGSLSVRNLSRDERNIPVASIRVDKVATVKHLIVRDCKMINRLDKPIPFFDVRGRVDRTTAEDNDFHGLWTNLPGEPGTR